LVVPCDQQLFRSKKTLRFWTYIDNAWECMGVFLVAYTCFNLNLEDGSFMFWSKNYFCVKIWFIVTVVWRLLAELAKIRRIWYCQSHTHIRLLSSNCWSHRRLFQIHSYSLLCFLIFIKYGFTRYNAILSQVMSAFKARMVLLFRVKPHLKNLKKQKPF
jgi:hypothetical protein